jgi:eukaryotic-like serine/threonine-protein kinase
MKKIIAVYLVALIFATGCQSAEASIQTAIAQTQSAGTPVPTQTAWMVTTTPTSTFTPLPPFPSPSTLFMPDSTLAPTEPEPTIIIPTPIAAMVSPKDGMTLVYVPAGNFLMGSTGADPLAEPEEKPQRTVYVNAFWIDQTDVTNAMYAKCVQAGVCLPPSDTSSATHPSYYGNSEFDSYPVIWVSWDLAIAYCTWVGRRLPTDTEWEKAARGPHGRIYPWGNSAPHEDLLNYNDNVGDTTAVGSYPKGASPYGALDMTGDVSQWVNEWSSYFQKAIIIEENKPVPFGTSGSVRAYGYYPALRGASWNDNDVYARAASHGWDSLIDVADSNGFRCATSSP